MRKSESSRRTEKRGDLIVGGDRTEVPVVEVVQLTNKKVNVVRGKSVVLLQVIKGDNGKSSREIPPKDVNGGAGVLRRMNDVYYWKVERESWGDVNLNDNQGIMVYFRTPLKVMESTDEEGRGSETRV